MTYQRTGLSVESGRTTVAEIFAAAGIEPTAQSLLPQLA